MEAIGNLGKNNTVEEYRRAESASYGLRNRGR